MLWQLKISDATEAQLVEARKIAKLVDGLPIYLAHISGQISQSQLSMREYLLLFQDSSDILQGKGGGTNWMYEKAIDKVFDVALAELSDGARRLINVLSFLSPDGVPETALFPSQIEHQFDYLRYDSKKE